MICKFYLPHSNFDGCDEDHTAIALGHVCHLLFMLAKYLDVRHETIKSQALE